MAPSGVRPRSCAGELEAGLVAIDGEEVIAGLVRQRAAARRGGGRADDRDGLRGPVKMGERADMVVAVQDEFRADPADHRLESLARR